MQCLADNDTISSLDLSGNKLDDKFIDGLMKLLKLNKTIECITLGTYKGGNFITDNGIKDLSHFITKDCSLKQLYLLNNDRITTMALGNLLSMVENSNIERTDSSLPGKVFSKVSIALAQNQLKSHLDVLDLSNRNIKSEDLIRICDDISMMKGSLKEVNLSHNMIKANAARRLFKALRNHWNLRVLNLFGNRLDDSVMESLVSLMTSKMEDISLGNNDLTNSGVMQLSQSMIGNKTLKKLNLDGNDLIGMDCYEALEDIAKKSSLQVLSLNGTMINYDKRMHLKKLLTIPASMRAIPSGSQSIVNDALFAASDSNRDKSHTFKRLKKNWDGDDDEEDVDDNIAW